MRTALSFDDVLLVPKHNTIRSRSEVDTSVVLLGTKFHIPIIAANMPSICGAEMASAMAGPGGLGIVHRMCSIEEQAQMIRDSGVLPEGIGAAIGIGNDWKDRAKACIESGAGIICLDVAHGDQERVIEVAREFLSTFSTPGLIIGNIATAEAAGRFVRGIRPEDHKRVSLKVGVGGGSACTTRVRTGFGIPTLQSVLDVSAYLDGYSSQMQIIADGGIKNSGDINKCFAAGADAVMVGGLLAGTRETPGKVIKDDKTGRLFKVYRGSASYGAKKEYFGEAEYVEGAERLVDYKKDKAVEVLWGLSDGIRSGLTYCGASTLSEFQTKAEFIRITPAGFRESLPHGLLG